MARFADLEAYIDKISPAKILLETELRSKDGRVIGTADLLLVGDSVTVVDYKSGLVTDQGDVKTAYRRQTLLYATLASEWLELPVGEAALFSLRQGLVRLEVAKQERISIWDEALGALEAYNRAAPGEQVATASDASCTWCPHCVYCQAAWNAYGSGEVESLLGGAAVVGQIESTPIAAANGRSALFLVGLFGDGGREAHVADVPTELLDGLQSGERVGLAGLRRSPESPDSYGWAEGRSRLSAVT